MTDWTRLFPKFVTVNKPIDWDGTWSLSEPVQHLVFEHDGNDNLKAMPVVLVDTTKGTVIPTVPEKKSGIWCAVLALGASGLAGSVHTPPAGQTSYVTNVSVDYSDVSLGAAALIYCTLEDTGARLKFRHMFWVPVAAAARPSFVLHCDPPLDIVGDVIAQISGATVGDIRITCWGYDEVA